jgi:hypothetical protein
MLNTHNRRHVFRSLGCARDCGCASAVGSSCSSSAPTEARRSSPIAATTSILFSRYRAHFSGAFSPLLRSCATPKNWRPKIGGDDLRSKVFGPRIAARHCRGPWACGYFQAAAGPPVAAGAAAALPSIVAGSQHAASARADRKKGFLAHFFKKQETSLSKSV